jgi:hypothetical protein
MLVSLAAFLGMVGVLLVPASAGAAPVVPAGRPAIAASASAAHAQIGFPPILDIGALLRSILASLPPFLQSTLAPLFDFLIGQFCAIFRSCASP